MPDRRVHPSAEELLRYRPRLLGLAYRMLGELAPAEDVVQEAYLRWHQDAPADVRSPEAWLVTVVGRLAVDKLRRSATERAAYDGPWLPEPVATEFAGGSPEAALARAGDLSLALLVLLETLAPEERVAFLMREVFSEDYEVIAKMLDRSEGAVRQLVHRARGHVRAGRPRFGSPPDVKERILGRFRSALELGDREALLSLLAPDAKYLSDGGGKVYAARRPIVGAENIVRLLLGLRRRIGDRVQHRVLRLNGEPMLFALRDGQPYFVTELDLDGERIRTVLRVLNPDKLRRVEGDAVRMD